jgi:hypothetical protein
VEQDQFGLFMREMIASGRKIELAGRFIFCTEVCDAELKRVLESHAFIKNN